jgi:outer membrane biogenesis lipoprotein LolB
MSSRRIFTDYDAPMALDLSVQVPVDEAASLHELLQRLAVDADTAQLHPFDGEAVVQSVIALTGASIPVLRLWLRARVAERKSYRVVYDGTEYVGYTADEVERLVEALKADTDGD